MVSISECTGPAISTYVGDGPSGWCGNSFEGFDGLYMCSSSVVVSPSHGLGEDFISVTLVIGAVFEYFSNT